MRHIVKFNLYESITDQVNKKLTDEFYLLIDETNKRTLLFLCKNDDLISFCSLAKEGSNYEMNATTTIEPGYGIFIYEAAMMHAYPNKIYSDRTGSSEGALNIWDKYADERSDVKKFDVEYPIEPEDIGEDPDWTPSTGQQYMYQKAPEKWFNKLVIKGKDRLKQNSELLQNIMDIASDAWGKY